MALSAGQRVSQFSRLPLSEDSGYVKVDSIWVYCMVNNFE